MSATGVISSLSVRVTATDTAAAPVGASSQQVNEAFSLSLLAGTGSGKSDILLTKAINIAASSSTTVDLAGAVTDQFGNTITFAYVQAIYLVADASNTNNIVLGNGATDPYVGPFDAGTDTISVKPGACLFMADPAGWPVVATTGDLLKLGNSSSGTAVTGKLVVIGRSA